MIYRFRITSPENNEFVGEIDINKEQTWLELHNIIQQSVGYDSSQMASFYEIEADGERGREIALFEMNTGDEDDNINVVAMDVAIIREFSSLKQADFIYVFDFFSDRYFNIKLTAVDLDATAKTYPLCSSIKGEAPTQMIIDAENFENLIMEESSHKVYESADDYLGDFDDELGNDGVQFESLDDYEDLI